LEVHEFAQHGSPRGVQTRQFTALGKVGPCSHPSAGCEEEQRFMNKFALQEREESTSMEVLTQCFESLALSGGRKVWEECTAAAASEQPCSGWKVPCHCEIYCIP